MGFTDDQNPNHLPTDNALDVARNTPDHPHAAVLTPGQPRRKDRRQQQYDALTLAISRVLTPVMITMAVAVWLVHSLGDPQKCRKLGKGRTLGEISLEPNSESPVVTTPEAEHSPLIAAIFIGIFVVLMVTFTFLLVWLYKSGKTRIIMTWLILSVFLIFAYVGGLYIFDFCRSRCINLDWATLVLAVWNFTVMGLIAVFGVAPRIVNQAYLILMSALMAYIFRTLPSWAIWVILVALVIWDLFAVLHRYGPLQSLVKAARERGDPLPALVYDTNPEHIGRDESAPPAILAVKRTKGRSGGRRAEVEGTATGGTEADTEAEEGGNRRLFRRRRVQDEEDDSERGAAAESEEVMERDEEEEMGVGTLGAHLKLGLGDFVFYSILVAQASQEGAMTTVASFVAILAGLSVTLFLVTVYRKALPALPISICAGLLFHFLTRFTVQPLIEHLLPELLFF